MGVNTEIKAMPHWNCGHFPKMSNPKHWPAQVVDLKLVECIDIRCLLKTMLLNLISVEMRNTNCFSKRNTAKEITLCFYITLCHQDVTVFLCRPALSLVRDLWFAAAKNPSVQTSQIL